MIFCGSGLMIIGIGQLLDNNGMNIGAPGRSIRTSYR